VKKNCGKQGVEWYDKLLNAKRPSQFDRIWGEVPSDVKEYILKTSLEVQFPVKAPVSTRGKTASSEIEGIDQRPRFHGKASTLSVKPALFVPCRGKAQTSSQKLLS